MVVNCNFRMVSQNSPLIHDLKWLTSFGSTSARMASSGLRKQSTLFDMGIHNVPAEEAQKQTKHKFAVLCETHDIRQEKMKERKERKRLKKLEINHEHQCQFQERKKMTPRNAPKVAMLGVDPGHGDMIKDFAALSQAGKKLQWRESQNGKLNGVVRTHAKQTNWYHPYLWAAISLVGPKAHFSATKITKILQTSNPILYSSLHKGTVQKWLA